MLGTLVNTGADSVRVAAGAAPAPRTASASAGYGNAGTWPVRGADRGEGSPSARRTPSA